MVSAQEKKWQAEGDAHSLAEAIAINSDPARLKAAHKAAKDLADEAKQRADALKSVADKNPVERLRQARET